MKANYKVTITDHDYLYTKYTVYVSATSKNQAIVVAAGLVGGERQRMRGEPFPSQLVDPEVRLEKADLDEFWAKRDQVFVDESS